MTAVICCLSLCPAISILFYTKLWELHMLKIISGGISLIQPSFPIFQQEKFSSPLLKHNLDECFSLHFVKFIHLCNGLAFGMVIVAGPPYSAGLGCSIAFTIPLAIAGLYIYYYCVNRVPIFLNFKTYYCSYCFL